MALWAEEEDDERERERDVCLGFGFLIGLGGKYQGGKRSLTRLKMAQRSGTVGVAWGRGLLPNSGPGK